MTDTHCRLLPVMCIAYITQSLDKGTLATSSIMGWLVHVNAQGQDYALSGTLLWIGGLQSPIRATCDADPVQVSLSVNPSSTRPFASTQSPKSSATRWSCGPP